MYKNNLEIAVLNVECFSFTDTTFVSLLRLAMPKILCSKYSDLSFMFLQLREDSTSQWILSVLLYKY